MTIEEKLKHFEESSLERARAKSLELIAEHQAALEQIEQEHKEIKTRQAKLQIKAETEHLKQQMNMALSKEQLQIKRRITLQQNELKETLFTEVRAKLEEFMNTREYEQLLLSQIREILAIAGQEQVIIYIDPADSLRHSALQAECRVPITISAYSFLGGTRAVLPDRHILIDNSFATRLEEEKEAFTFDGGTSDE